MNRIMSNEIGLAAFARFGKALTGAAKRVYARTQLENELYGLDDRSLADIGISRGMIPAVASDALPGAEGGLFAEFSRLVVNGLLRPALDWNHRRKARATLLSLDDRMLADIGLNRYDIPAAAAGDVSRGDSFGVHATSFAGAPANRNARAA